MDEKKKINPSNKDCANCGASGAKLTCAACKAAHYCSKSCQAHHWRNGHKGMCVAPDKRRPQATSSFEPDPETAKANNSSECPICFDSLSQGTTCRLPCKHDFHRECVGDLRKYGVLQVCPLCRTALPAGPEQLLDDAIRTYIPLLRKVGKGRVCWQTLTASDKNTMAEVVAKLVTAADQGFAEAQDMLGILYTNGEGVKQNFEEAVKWFRQAADQGNADAQCSLGLMYENEEEKKKKKK
mmetsp:Transcript_72542/g.142095  ORF Transcript_72542/g.142095 Transcript_72542/m.142095 type:complete len:240 (-) Transcript_72542:1-720(-)